MNNKRKIDDSNAKRLESLKKQAEEFKQKKYQIRNDLLNPEAGKNKKILFNQDDDEEQIEEKQKMIHLLDQDEENIEEINESEDTTNQPKQENLKKPTVQIETNLKELFCSNDVFKFEFSNLDEKVAESLSSDDDESIQSESNDSFLRQTIIKTPQNEQLEEAKQPRVSKSNSVISKFLPDFSNDDQIRDALVFFCTTRTEEELREDWSSKRETLVQEYKKKHKRMIRIKKHKDNEKLLSWKVKKTSK